MKNKFQEIPENKRSISKRKQAHGIGINDSDYVISATVNGKRVVCPFYLKWNSMLQRCYSEDFQNKNPTYIDCTVCDEWLTFSNFRLWMEKKHWEGNHLDKDIIKTGNKIYSPDTCIFVTPQINALINDSAASRGVYPQGVCLHKPLNKFIAECNVNGKRQYLGLSNTAEEAGKVYKVFKSKLIRSVAEKQHEPLRGYLIRIAGEFNHNQTLEK